VSALENHLRPNETTLLHEHPILAFVLTLFSPLFTFSQ